MQGSQIVAAISRIDGDRILLTFEAAPEVRAGAELSLLRWIRFTPSVAEGQAHPSATLGVNHSGKEKVARVRVRTKVGDTISADLVERFGDPFAAVGDEVVVLGLPAVPSPTHGAPARPTAPASPPVTPLRKGGGSAKAPALPDPRVKLPPMPAPVAIERLPLGSPKLTVAAVRTVIEDRVITTVIDLQADDLRSLNGELAESIKVGDRLVALGPDTRKAVLVVREVTPEVVRARLLRAAPGDSVNGEPVESMVRVGDAAARVIPLASQPGEATVPIHIATLRDALVVRGYENVVVKADSTGNAVLVEYENRLMRWSVTALGEVLALTTRSFPERTRIRVVPKRSNVPIMSVSVEAGAYLEFLRGGLTKSDLRQVLHVSEEIPKTATGDRVPTSSKSPSDNPSAGRIDVTAAPGVRVRFGTKSERDLQFVPGADVTLARGLKAETRAIYSSEQRELSLNMAKLTQNARAGSNLFYSVSGGRFNSTFEGGLLEIGGFTRDGRHGLLLDLSRTRDFQAASRMGNSALLSYRYHLGYIDTALVGTVGQFLRGDKGGRLELVSTFRESDVGFFYSNTQMTTEFGFEFRLPLPPKQYARPAPVRFHTREAFPFRFSTPATGGAESLDSPLLELHDRLGPARVLTQLDALREAGTPWTNLHPEALVGEMTSMESGFDRLTTGGFDRLTTGRSSPPFAWGTPSLSGLAGLLNVPTASVMPFGSYAIGLNVVDDRHRGSPSPVALQSIANYITVGVLPNLEASIRFTNRNGQLGLRKDNLGGIGDRMFSMQWRLLSEQRSRPAVAIGIQDVLSGKDFNLLGVSRLYPARFIAASKQIGEWGHAQPVRATLGFGRQRLSGAFWGLDGQLNLAKQDSFGAHWMLEYDTSHLNAGMRWQLPVLRHLYIDTALMAADRFAFGFGYSRPF